MSDYVVHLTRWTFLRMWPGAWLAALRTYGVSPWNPYAWGLFIRGAFVLLFARGAS